MRPLFESRRSDFFLVDKQTNPLIKKQTSLVGSNQETHTEQKPQRSGTTEPSGLNSLLLLLPIMNSNNGNKAASAHALKQQRTLPYTRPSNTSKTARQSPLLQSTRSLGRQSLVPQANMQVETVPVNDLVQLARSAFSQKDFTAALQFLTRALAVAPKNINLLDSRAASYEKLGQLDKALDDAKAMIRTYPQNPKVQQRVVTTSEVSYLCKRRNLLFVGSSILTERDLCFLFVIDLCRDIFVQERL